MKSWKTLAVAAMVASSLFAAVPAFAADPGTVSVTGYAQQEVAPDTAFVTIGLSTTASDAQEARTKNNTTMTQITNGMKALGIGAENLRTTDFYMSPNYDNKGKISGYTVSNNLEVKVSDLNLLSTVITKAGSLGANQINNVRFTNEHADQIKNNLIKEAVHNGQQAAAAAAQAAGTSLGAVKEMSISGNSPSYNTMALGAVSLRMAKAEAADAVAAPVEAGTNTLSQRVNITYYLQ